ncbi:protein FAM185A [Drosophila innubila]|uniref:protein FAM185A n=1 Tax=Drosophila innubila TaxID=198719 RepID=UPI00148C4987|nr:protein FAM185A [Drosophila innubila]
MQILQRLRWFPPISVNNYFRYYAKKSKPAMTSSRRMVQQEFLHYVNPYARINVKSDIFLKVEPVDVHVHTSGDVFIAQLLGEATHNCNAKLDVNVSDDDKVVNVLVTKLTTQAGRSRCYLKIPVRAEVHVDGGAKVFVQSIQGEALQVRAAEGITTKNVRATNISLFSENGDIVCEGTLLGKSTEIETHIGNIVLDKLQGDSLKCSTKAGSIKTDCCYVENSKFETTTGQMELKNVHKTSEVHVHDAGDLKMTGVHGNLSVNSKGGNLSLQLSELTGKSQIVAQNLANEAVINISEAIETNINIEVKASQVNLDNELEHVSHALSNDKSIFQLKNNNEHQLLISSTGKSGVRLGKQSWMDIMRQTININDKS